MACARRPGGMLFVKASDRPFDEAQLLRSFDRRATGRGSIQATYVELADDPGAAALIGSQPTWLWGLEHGVNEHRVAIGNERIWTVDDARAAAPGLIGMDLVRLALERGRDADEAVDVLTSLLATHGQGGSGHADGRTPYWSSFLIIDPVGGWVVETSDRSWVAQAVADGTSVSNRLTLSTGWSRGSADVVPGEDWDRRRSPRIDTALADHRLAASRRWLAGGDATPAGATALLRDHGTGPWGRVASAPADEGAPPPPPEGVRRDWSHVTVCMHVRGHEATTAAFIADLPDDRAQPVRAWSAPGNPCIAPFLPIATFGADPPVVPAVLADLQVWSAFATWGRAVEQPGDAGASALEARRARIAPIEAAAWADAEDLWAAGAAPGAWRTAAARWDRAVRAALDTQWI